MEERELGTLDGYCLQDSPIPFIVQIQFCGYIRLPVTRSFAAFILRSQSCASCDLAQRRYTGNLCVCEKSGH